jgi:hypothetical protein
MPTISLTLNVRANDGAPDNNLFAPAGGDVYVELNRGFNCVIASFGVAICSRDATGKLHVETTLEDDGQFPAPKNPNGPPPRYRLGAPAEVLNRCIVIPTSAATDSGVIGSIDVIVTFLQQGPDEKFRRIAWIDDPAQAVQHQSRFETDILP